MQLIIEQSENKHQWYIRDVSGTESKICHVCYSETACNEYITVHNALVAAELATH
jgi:hypothetical protein